jgi:hypothetical protein
MLQQLRSLGTSIDAKTGGITTRIGGGTESIAATGCSGKTIGETVVTTVATTGTIVARPKERTVFLTSRTLILLC